MSDYTKGLVATAILNGVIWATTGCVAAVAVKKTGNGRWGWLMIVPALSSFTYRRETETPIQEQ